MISYKKHVPWYAPDTAVNRSSQHTKTYRQLRTGEYMIKGRSAISEGQRKLTWTEYSKLNRPKLSWTVPKTLQDKSKRSKYLLVEGKFKQRLEQRPIAIYLKKHSQMTLWPRKASFTCEPAKLGWFWTRLCQSFSAGDCAGQETEERSGGHTENNQNGSNRKVWSFRQVDQTAKDLRASRSSPKTKHSHGSLYIAEEREQCSE